MPEGEGEAAEDDGQDRAAGEGPPQAPLQEAPEGQLLGAGHQDRGGEQEPAQEGPPPEPVHLGEAHPLPSPAGGPEEEQRGGGHQQPGERPPEEVAPPAAPVQAEVPQRAPLRQAVPGEDGGGEHEGPGDAHGVPAAGGHAEEQEVEDVAVEGEPPGPAQGPAQLAVLGSEEGPQGGRTG